VAVAAVYDRRIKRVLRLAADKSRLDTASFQNARRAFSEPDSRPHKATFAVFGVGGDEVERMAGEKPVKTLESRRTLVRIHGGIVAAVCDRRKKFEWRTAVTDRCYSERCAPTGLGNGVARVATKISLRTEREPAHDGN